MSTLSIDDFDFFIDRGADLGYDPFANPEVREWITVRELKKHEPGWMKPEDFYWDAHSPLGKRPFFYNKTKLSLVKRPGYTVEIRRTMHIIHAKFPTVDIFLTRMNDPASHQAKLQKKLGTPQEVLPYFADGYTPKTPIRIPWRSLRLGEWGWIRHTDLFWQKKDEPSIRPFIKESTEISTRENSEYNLSVWMGYGEELWIIFKDLKHLEQWVGMPGTYRTDSLVSKTHLGHYPRVKFEDIFIPEKEILFDRHLKIDLNSV